MNDQTDGKIHYAPSPGLCTVRAWDSSCLCFLHRYPDFKDGIRTFGFEAFVIDLQRVCIGHLLSVFRQPRAKDVFIALMHPVHGAVMFEDGIFGRGNGVSHHPFRHVRRVRYLHAGDEGVFFTRGIGVVKDAYLIGLGGIFHVFDLGMALHKVSPQFVQSLAGGGGAVDSHHGEGGHCFDSGIQHFCSFFQMVVGIIQAESREAKDGRKQLAESTRADSGDAAKGTRESFLRFKLVFPG
jgi:hypothetical protein